MTHLLVHLVKEIIILRPVFLHTMFPFKRFMGVLKKYVHSRSRPEGIIAQSYGMDMLTLFQTLTRLAFLNHDMRVDSVARGHYGRKHISVQGAIT